MKNILVVMTGGTIGSYSDNGIISIKKGNCRAIELYQETFPSDDSFTIVQPIQILSENLEKSHWETLVNFLYHTDLSQFDGIIITHGSDTLSYSSAILGICCQHFPIPVIITASNYIPDDEKSNAVANIAAAVTLIHTFPNGVFTVYQNDGDNFCSIFLAARIQEADRFLGKFSSFDGTPFGKISNNHFQKLTDFSYPVHHEPVLEDTSLSLPNDILMIRPYPSMLYSAISIPKSVKAVLHIPYHSATAKTDGNENALSFLNHCQNHHIDFYIPSVKNSSVYETGNLLIQNGAVPIYNMSNETAFAKLLLLYNCHIKNRSSFLETDL